MRIKYNDLTHYFLRPHNQLPQAYLASCEKFFKSIKQQAPSSKPQASSLTAGVGYDRMNLERNNYDKQRKTKRNFKVV
jgi:hypothetical protein